MEINISPKMLVCESGCYSDGKVFRYPFLYKENTFSLSDSLHTKLEKILFTEEIKGHIVGLACTSSFLTGVPNTGTLSTSSSGSRSSELELAFHLSRRSSPPRLGTGSQNLVRSDSFFDKKMLVSAPSPRGFTPQKTRPSFFQSKVQLRKTKKGGWGLSPEEYAIKDFLSKFKQVPSLEQSPKFIRERVWFKKFLKQHNISETIALTRNMANRYLDYVHSQLLKVPSYNELNPHSARLSSLQGISLPVVLEKSQFTGSQKQYYQASVIAGLQMVAKNIRVPKLDPIVLDLYTLLHGQFTGTLTPQEITTRRASIRQVCLSLTSSDLPILNTFNEVQTRYAPIFCLIRNFQSGFYKVPECALSEKHEAHVLAKFIWGLDIKANLVLLNDIAHALLHEFVKKVVGNNPSFQWDPLQKTEVTFYLEKLLTVAENTPLSVQLDSWELAEGEVFFGFKKADFVSWLQTTQQVKDSFSDWLDAADIHLTEMISKSPFFDETGEVIPRAEIFTKIQVAPVNRIGLDEIRATIRELKQGEVFQPSLDQQGQIGQVSVDDQVSFRVKENLFDEFSRTYKRGDNTVCTRENFTKEDKTAYFQYVDDHLDKQGVFKDSKPLVEDGKVVLTAQERRVKQVQHIAISDLVGNCEIIKLDQCMNFVQKYLYQHSRVKLSKKEKWNVRSLVRLNVLSLNNADAPFIEALNEDEHKILGYVYGYTRADFGAYDDIDWYTGQDDCHLFGRKSGGFDIPQNLKKVSVLRHSFCTEIEIAMFPDTTPDNGFQIFARALKNYRIVVKEAEYALSMTKATQQLSPLRARYDEIRATLRVDKNLPKAVSRLNELREDSMKVSEKNPYYRRVHREFLEELSIDLGSTVGTLAGIAVANEAFPHSVNCKLFSDAVSSYSLRAENSAAGTLAGIALTQQAFPRSISSEKYYEIVSSYRAFSVVTFTSSSLAQYDAMFDSP